MQTVPTTCRAAPMERPSGQAGRPATGTGQRRLGAAIHPHPYLLWLRREQEVRSGGKECRKRSVPTAEEGTAAGTPLSLALCCTSGRVATTLASFWGLSLEVGLVIQDKNNQQNCPQTPQHECPNMSSSHRCRWVQKLHEVGHGTYRHC